MRIRHARRPFAIPSARHLQALLVLTLLLVMPAQARAEVKRTVLPASTDPTGHLNISPGRYEHDVTPGTRQVFQVELLNDNDQAIDVSVDATDLGQSTDPHNVASRVEGGEFGAGDWLTPEVRDLRLLPFERVRFNVVVDPPVDAPVGTSLAGVAIDSTLADGSIGTRDATGNYLAEGLIQVFLTVPGPVSHKLRITDVKVRDKFVFGSQRFAVWDVTFRNDGTVNEHVNGSVDVNSIFGNSAYHSRIRELIVLRGATRTTRVVWNDLPWVGAFSATAKVRGDDARQVEASSGRVVVFPWWLGVLLAVVILGPFLFLWWRRRQDWKQFLEEDDWSESDEAGHDSMPGH